MARKAAEPLEKKDIILFEGDWDELAAILAPFKIKPTVFIRQLVRKKINQIRARAAEHAQPMELPDDIELDITSDDSGTGKPK